MNQRRGEIPRLYYLVHSITQEERLDYSSLIWPLVFSSNQAIFSPELILTPSLVSSVDYIHVYSAIHTAGKEEYGVTTVTWKKHCVCSVEGGKKQRREVSKEGNAMPIPEARHPNI